MRPEKQRRPLSSSADRVRRANYYANVVMVNTFYSSLCTRCFHKAFSVFLLFERAKVEKGATNGRRERGEKVFARSKSEGRKSHQDTGYFNFTLNGINELQPPHSQCQDFYQVMCCLILSLRNKSQCATMDHFRVALNLIMKARLSTKFLL